MSHKLMYLSTWPLFGGAVLGGFRGVVLLEEICDRQWALRVKSSQYFQFVILLSVYGS